MANNTKDIVMHGIGKGIMIDTVTKKAVLFDKAQELTVELNTDTEEVFGGDSIYAIYTYATKSECTFKLKNAVFNPAQLALIASTDIKTTGIKSTDFAKVTKTDTTIGKNLTGVKVHAVFDPSGDNIEFVTGTSAPAKGVAITETGAIKFSTESVDGEYTIAYEHDTTGTSTMILGDKLANPVEIYHTFYPEQLDGTRKVLTFHIPKARCDGSVTIDTARDSAAAPELTFKALKDEGADDIMTMTVADVVGK